MQNFDTQKLFANSQQFESMLFAPARAFASMTVDCTEKLIQAQMEATQAYTDISRAQLRSLLDIKDADGLRAYLEGQQTVAKDLTERVKGDAEKVVSLQQHFIKQSQKLAEENVKQVTETASKAVK